MAVGLPLSADRLTRLTVAPSTLVNPVPGFSSIATRAVRWLNSKVGLLNSTFRFSAAMKSLFWKSTSLLWSSATFTAGICVMSALSKGHHADTVIGSRLVQ